MSPFMKGIILLMIHVCLVLALGGKLLYDRATLPRVWVRSLPFDPDLPVRGRYVSLQFVVDLAAGGKKEGGIDRAVSLRVVDGRLTAEQDREKTYGRSGMFVRYTHVDSENVTVLSKPVAFFIPEHIPDPSIRSKGEQLWVEATIPRKGPPRPIRLGVKKGDGPIQALEIR